MFLVPINIEKKSFVSDIVMQDYRTASVFSKYDIDFCCGGKWQLGPVCEMQGLEFSTVKKELEDSLRRVQLSNSIRYTEWNIDFLTEYIINIHHQYLKDVLPLIHDHLKHFIEEHEKSIPELGEVLKAFTLLYKDIFNHLKEEEEVLFPYIRQIDHAYKSGESYAGLFVRTMRKPVEEMMKHEHDTVSKILNNLRTHSNNYTPPGNACLSHRVAFSMLQELDQDLTQHVYLENEILFPKALAMEKELIRKN